jgi:hypothetical protein
LVAQAAHDLDPGQVAAVDGPVERLPRKGLLVDPPVGPAVEEAADPRLELVDDSRRVVDERPG